MTTELRACALLIEAIDLIDRLWQDAADQDLDTADDYALISDTLHRVLLGLDLPGIRYVAGGR